MTIVDVLQSLKWINGNKNVSCIGLQTDSKMFIYINVSTDYSGRNLKFVFPSSYYSFELWFKSDAMINI